MNKLKKEFSALCIPQIIAVFVAMFQLFSCSEQVSEFSYKDEYPAIYPDYVEVTIPPNIAPLNFKSKLKCEKMKVKIKGKKQSVEVVGNQKIQIPESEWKSLLASNSGDTLWVNIFLKIDGKWLKYKPFSWFVAPEKIDPFLSYRLIEPGYEVWNKLQICERNLENFDERAIVDNNLTGDACINCHTYNQNNPGKSFFHVRHKNGGTFINDNGKIRKINTKGEGSYSALIYGNWHPASRFIVFSTNVIIPEFHATNNKRLEVYDTKSDVVVFDTETNEMFTSPLLSGENAFETFPVFSADGRKIYFCSAKAVKLPEQFKAVKYSLCSISFDPANITFGNRVDTLVSALKTGKTVSQPEISPDGRYLLYTWFDYGNFPIWHKEADLRLLDLTNGKTDSLPKVNSENSDTYHSWSSNSRWFVFASKRDNGMYGKPYIAYLDKFGKAHKALVIPQKDADFYDFCLKSFNIPELSKGPVPFDALDIEKAFNNLKAEKVKRIGN